MPQPLEKVLSALIELERTDLALLIEGGRYSLEVVEDPPFPGDVVCQLSLTTFQAGADALRSLPNTDRRRLSELIIKTDPGVAAMSLISEPPILVRSSGDAGSDLQELFAEVILQRQTMIDVATGGQRIQDVNDYYRARRKGIASGLRARGLKDPNSIEDLWDWYRKWSNEFPSYRERRAYIFEMYADLVRTLSSRSAGAVPEREPTGWERVDRAIDKARARLHEGSNEEDYQAVGLLCREALISLGQAVYDPARHATADGVVPSSIDARRMIEAYLRSELGGATFESTRRHVGASLSLAIELQHRRTAGFRLAALSLEATASIANAIAILSGMRDPGSPPGAE